MNRGASEIMTSRAGWRALVAWTAACLVALVWSLAVMRIDRTRTVEAGTANLRNLWPFWIASAGVWIGLTAMWQMLARSARENIGAQQGFWRNTVLVFAVALGARVAILILHDPGLSDDVNRYIFDGRNLAAHANPYLVVPAQQLIATNERFPGEKQLIPLVTYPELVTPYLPVSQCVFGTIGSVIGERWSDPVSSARVFRIGFVAIECVLMFLTLLWLKHSGRSAWWAALYAWHPLSISEIAGSGHQDVIGIALLVASLVLFTTAPAKIGRWSTLLAMSAMGKPFTLPAGTLMLRGRPARDWLRSMIFGALVIVIALAPFWLVWGDRGQAYHNWRVTAGTITEKFAHFGGVYEPVLSIVRVALPADGKPAGYNLTQEWLARKICLGILAIAAIGIYRSRLDAVAATRAILLALVLLTTTAHPWYLLWAFALVPMSNSWTLWVLSLTLPWGYAVLGDVMHWKVPPWVFAAAYLPVLCALIADVVIHWRTTPAPHGQNEASNDSRATS